MDSLLQAYHITMPMKHEDYYLIAVAWGRFTGLRAEVEAIKRVIIRGKPIESQIPGIKYWHYNGWRFLSKPDFSIDSVIEGFSSQYADMAYTVFAVPTTTNLHKWGQVSAVIQEDVRNG